VRSKRPYTPISCSFVDLIEHYAVKRLEIPVVYYDKENKVSVSDRIKTWETKDSVEYIILLNGTTIRMDDIVSIDGNSLSEASNSCRF